MEKDKEEREHTLVDERTLRASVATLRSAFRAIPDAILVTTLPEGRLIEFNNGFTRWTGYRREEALGRTTQELKLWGREGGRGRMLNIVRAKGRVNNLEVLIRQKSGDLRHCLMSAELISTEREECLVSVVRDITEKKQAQEALRASEEKFAKAFRASPDAILITTIADGKFADVNEGFTRISGWSREEVVGQTAGDIQLWVEPEKRDLLMTELRRKGRVSERPYDFRMKSKEVRSFLVWIEVIEIAGEPHILTVAHDITERRRVEAERETAFHQLEAKAAELERFTYTVSHDLKSPLVTVRGFLGLLERSIERGDRQQMRKDIERIKGATDTMSQLLDELLELSHAGQPLGSTEEIPWGELARDVMSRLAGSIGEWGMRVEVQSELPTVLGDRTRLLQVLQNLVENAIKFSAGESEPWVQVGAMDQDGEQVFFVRDNGVGIDPRYHDHVFELFQRLDPSVEGTGVGLALVKRIIEVHGGRIWVESEGLGHGSTFCFTLATPKPE